MTKQKVLNSLADLKEIVVEEREAVVAAEAKPGIDAVVAYLETIKIDDRVAANQARLDERDKYYQTEAELASDLELLNTLEAQFEMIPRIIELRRIFKEQQKQAFDKQRAAGNGRIIPTIHKDSKLAQDYRATYAEIVEARKVYDMAVLVEVQNRISNARAYLKAADIRNKEQVYWDKK